MRYMILVCVDESVEVSPEDSLPTAWVEEMDARGVRKFGSRLRPVSDATTVQVRGGEVLLSDGPFAETKEQIGGFDLLECADLDEAIEVASKHPAREVRDDRGEAALGGLTPDVEAAVADAFQQEWGRVVATLIRMTGDWDLAEECAQDAFAVALERWPRDGVPLPPRRVAHHDGPQPRAGPLAPRRRPKPRSCGRERRCGPATNRTPTTNRTRRRR